MIARNFLLFILGYSFLTVAVRENYHNSLKADLKSESTSEGNSTLDDEESMPGKPRDSVIEYFIQRCIEYRAGDFLNLIQRLNVSYLPIPKGPEAVNGSVPKLLELIDDVVGIKETQYKRKATRGKLANLLHWDRFSSRARRWNKELQQLEEAMASWGFSFNAAEARCRSGRDQEAYECMLDKAGPNLRSALQRRFDFKDVVKHPAGSKHSKAIYQEIRKLDETLRADDYARKKIKKECVQEMHHKAEDVHERLLADLGSGQTNEDGTCVEHADKMCPEGSYATTKRRRDMVKGATAGTAMYIFGKVVVTPAFAMAGTVFGGPAGATAGTLTGGMVASWIAMAAAYYGSLGPYECACFVRDCSFNNVTEQCELAAEEDSPSKNPFSSSLPMIGMKCEPKYKKTDECMVTECGDADFEQMWFPESNTHNVAPIFGFIGRHEAGIYNCLSTTGSPAGAFMLDERLPNGENNTAKMRADFYKELNVLKEINVPSE